MYLPFVSLAVELHVSSTNHSFSSAEDEEGCCCCHQEVARKGQEGRRFTEEGCRQAEDRCEGEGRQEGRGRQAQGDQEGPFH